MPLTNHENTLYIGRSKPLTDGTVLAWMASSISVLPPPYSIPSPRPLTHLCLHRLLQHCASCYLSSPCISACPPCHRQIEMDRDNEEIILTVSVWQWFISSFMFGIRDTGLSLKTSVITKCWITGRLMFEKGTHPFAQNSNIFCIILADTKCDREIDCCKAK